MESKRKKSWRVFLIVLCFTPLALIIIPYLILTRKPTVKIVEGRVARRFTRVIHAVVVYYVEIDGKKFSVSPAIYKNLSVGDYVVARYKSNPLFYDSILVELLSHSRI